jgi:MFS transporter, DHA2 family, multidrug resistance protein
MNETTARKSRFDFFGFITLSLAIGALQLMLDRGQLVDWFSSREIWCAAIVSGVAFYLFVVHMLTTTEAPFINVSLFKDRNFLTGNLFIFIVGIALFATLALLPPMLQDLMNYSVLLTGLVTAPRGVGTFVAMFLSAPLSRRMDSRLIIALGFALTAVSLWWMSHFYLQMDSSVVVWSGMLSGLGVGLVYVPLAAISFATLPPVYRNEGTAAFSLVRNIGSSIGISAVTVLFTRNTQIMHARLAEHLTPFGAALRGQMADGQMSPHAMAMLNHQVTTQAEMIAYNNDFWLMMVMAAAAIPLVLLLRKVQPKPTDEPVVIE